MNVQMEPTRPKITHRHTDPVSSEVFLTNGTVLKQTYFGTTPSGSPYPPDSFDSDSSRKISGQSTPSSRKTSANTTPDIKEKKDHQHDGQTRKFSTDTTEEGDRHKVGSPYMVINSATAQEPILEGSLDAATEKKEEEGLKVEIIVDAASQQSVLEGSINDKPANSDSICDSINSSSVPLKQELSTTDIDTWIGDVDCDHDSTLIGNLMDDDSESSVSDGEHSLKVECDSEQDVLSDNQSNITDEDIDLPESEVQSEVEIGEEEHIHRDDTILLGESAVDFRGRKSNNSAKRKSLKGKTLLPGYTEFPEIKEEAIEKIEYLTPKEVKAMQVARRKKSEWERRLQKRSFTPPKSVDSLKSKSASNIPSDKAKESLNFKINHFESIQQQYMKRKQSNPLIKRLLQHNFETAESSLAKEINKKIKVQVIQQVDQISKENIKKSAVFKPIKVEVGNKKGKSNSLKKEQAEKANETSVVKSKTSNIQKTPPTLKKIQSSNYNKQKSMGHRRLKSAPLRIARNEDTLVPSQLTPDSPFICVNQVTEESRERSQSLGTRYKGQRALSKMAARICKEDGIDAERDIPEVLQVSFA